MDQRTIQILFALLRSAICGTKLTEEDQSRYSPDMLQDLLDISFKHDIAHLLVLGLKQNGLIAKEQNSIEKHIFKAVYRYENLNYEFNRLCTTLEKAQIPFLPLKGAVIRLLYPEPWMRTSCDIDVLVHEKDLQRAVEALRTDLSYKAEKYRDYHDISLFSPKGIHLELHFSIKENMESIDVLLSKAWDYSDLVEGTKYQYRQTNEYFIFHHIAHMAHHFVSGGCGIRPLVDLYFIKQKLSFDARKVQEFLSACALQKFYDSITKLMKVWLEEKPHCDVTWKMQDYILQGGVYGSLVGNIAAKQGIKGGKFRYAWSRVFLSTKLLENYYPCIKRHTWLAPFCQIHRWTRIFRDSTRFNHSIHELKSNYSISEKSVHKVKQLLDELGL